ncbi:MAG: PilZ domain-containing protein [Candidatus Sulfotelmatobacter sp.]
MMTTAPVSVERRIGQRFTFNLPISLRHHASSEEGLGFTQDVSSRGAFFFTDMPLNTGAEIELTLQMPAEITLGESMRVRCKGRILRVLNSLAESGSAETSAFEINSAETKSAPTSSTQTSIGVAVCFTDYEYLPEREDTSADFRRISALHETSTGDRRPPSSSASPRGATG